MSNRMVITDVTQLISKINSTAQHISSTADLKHLDAHDEVKVFCIKGQGIMARVDWQAQVAALSGISMLTYSQACFSTFHAGLPELIEGAEQAKHNAEQASHSLGQAAAQLGDLSHEAGESVGLLSAQAQQLAQWEVGDRRHQGGFNVAGHVLGPLTLGFGYLLWLGANDFECKADSHCQSAKNVHDIHDILSEEVGPKFHEGVTAMEVAALFFAALANKLEHIVITGAEATSAPASEMHLHFEEMRQSIVKMCSVVDALAVFVASG